MKLADQQTTALERDGFLMVPNLIGLNEVALLRSRQPALLGEDSPTHIVEKASG